jgi:hypothetical protein
MSVIVVVILTIVVTTEWIKEESIRGKGKSGYYYPTNHTNVYKCQWIETLLEIQLDDHIKYAIWFLVLRYSFF